MSEWVACTDKLPRHNSRVAVLASNPGYQSGCLQTLAGWFKATYYDLTINRFSLIDVNPEAWKVTHWMELPEPPKNIPTPFDPGFADLFSWEGKK